LNKDEEILGLNNNYTSEDVKRCFRVLALKYHPDKNNDEDASIKFQEVYEAYEYINNNDWIKVSKEEGNYYDKRFDNVFDIFMKTFKSKGGIRIDPVLLNNLLHLISIGCKKLSKRMIDMFDKESLLKMLSYAIQLKDILGLTKEDITEMEYSLKSNDEDNEVYLLNPNLNNLLLDQIYVLNHNNKKLYIPLWHSEVIYDLSGETIVTRCVPELPEHISIDEDNNLHIKIEICLKDLLKTRMIDVSEYTPQTETKIPVDLLFMRKEQTYILKNKGISVINTKEIFNISNRANLIFYIKIIDFV